MTNQKLPKKPRKRLKRKTKEGATKENETDKKDKMVAPLQQELMLLRPYRAQKKSNAIVKALKKTSLRSPAIIVIKKITILGIPPSQKTSYSLSNFHVGDD